MELSDQLLGNLQTLAEIAVTIAGFSAIVGSIEARQDNPMSQIRKSAYHSLLSAAVCLILLSYAPIWFSYLFDDIQLVWRSCFVVWIILIIASTSLYFMASKIDQALVAKNANMYGRIIARTEYFFVPASTLLSIIAVACLFGYLEAHYLKVYFTMLMYMLVLAVTGFMVLVTYQVTERASN